MGGVGDRARLIRLAERRLEPDMAAPLSELLADAGGADEDTAQARDRAAKAIELGPDWIRDDAGLARGMVAFEGCFVGEFRQFEMAVEPEGNPFRRQVCADLAKTTKTDLRSRVLGTSPSYRWLGDDGGHVFRECG